jgi:RTX calcium-binding nonapeptide repeat (4 copies)
MRLIVSVSNHSLTILLLLIIITSIFYLCINCNFLPFRFNNIFAQPSQTIPSGTELVKITSHKTNQTVANGELTIHGISSDSSTKDCTVYLDWNNLKPYQIAIPKTVGINNDYSTWTFTYKQNYHLIVSGSNELTAKISCFNPTTNQTTNKWNSIIVIGVDPALLAKQNITSNASTPKVQQNITSNASTPKVQQNITSNASTPKVQQNITSNASTPKVQQNITSNASTPKVQQNITSNASTPKVQQNITSNASTPKVQQNITSNASTLENSEIVLNYNVTRVRIDGTERDDNISGLVDNSLVVGKAGNDIIKAGNGDDLIQGGTGNDKIFGGNGNDILFGGLGDDILTGGKGADVFYCGVGRDTITDYNSTEGDMRSSDCEMVN